MNISLFIVADRGGLKAYQLAPPPNRSATPSLLESYHLESSRSRPQEQNTDKSGSFPNSGAQGTSAGERHHLAAENESRTIRDIAQHIAGLLRAYRPSRWAFAAPSEINHAILSDVPISEKAHLAANLPLDLFNAPPDSLISHLKGAAR